MTQPTDDHVELPSTELPIEDALDQRRDLAADAGELPASLPRLEVSDADFVEQNLDVPLDDEDYDRG